jgi:ketosteroid isomerase-like protein
MPSLNQNLQIANIIFSALNNRTLDRLEDYLDANATFDFPGTKLIKGRKKILTFFKILFRKYPRLTFTVQESIVDGGKVCIVWTNEGVTSNNTPYANQGVTYVHISDGKIHFISDYFKNTSFIY